ncbi:uncharacterized protein SPAPADRAFT_60387 [Spathaspora passalidarum NRRL Y-27907]|uniref:Chromosome segregation in meiosis protein n=1 Tax=Spathaspora passalidarum (strain NRRL Y-27907 / 11-Y1) TaxID=619300 RepID=G3AL32_SPAPN|nr:uncharacterized protein SPAPADRAFT_60387 [Spathaspora passalidarum NRRL Y-27907]EGW33076.1 hypothetical protein SPAPADRAFT_60387 [Spathaspora passalidarum NRRL Y-27907]
MEQDRNAVAAANDAEDVLGLDQPLKLKKRAKIARIDNQRIFSSHGIPYIVKNHSQLSRTISRNDRHFMKKYPLASKSQKLDHEYNNLVSVLQFYQLWCHGLFPKANFRDCIQLIRGLGGKSPQLKLYRRQLMEAELNKLRVEKGIIDNVPEDIDVDASLSEVNQPVDASATGETSVQANVGDEDDDWDFMNVAAPRNRLFVGDDDDDDDDDLYQVPEHPVETRDKIVEQANNSKDTSKETDELDDPFSDDEDLELVAAQLTQAPQESEHPEPPFEDDENDLELMREFGM